MIDLTTDREGIAILLFDAPGEKVNLLGEKSLAALEAALVELERGCAAGSVRAVVLESGKKGVFLAGADVKAFVAVAEAGDAAAAAAKARAGQALFSRLAALPAPAVAAINGACLGGGLELALACTARVAADVAEVTLGLPEVRLGLVPGWGGTQRLPRLVGPSRALELILTGRSLSSRQARRIGLVDAVVPLEALGAEARAEASRLAAGQRPRRPAWSLLDRAAFLRPLVFAMARRGAIKQTRGHYPAPLAAIDAVQHGLSRGVPDGLAHEADLVGRLLVGDVSRNLVRIFLASRGTTASSPPAAGAGPGAATIERIGVLGAGTMGGGIAAVAAMSGLWVRLKDVDAAALARGMKQVHALAVEAVRKGRQPAHEANRREGLVAPAVDSSGLARCELIVEAVVEDLAVKREVFRELEAAVGPSTILATNTSSLSVTDIAAGLARPGRVLGLHFFNPVEKMPLVEVVRGPDTEQSAVEAACQLARRMGKTPVVVRDTPGFIVNRILMPYLAGAIEGLCGSGEASEVRAIDQAMVRFGMPMGPFELLDRIGIDVAARVAGVLRAAFPSRGSGTAASALLQAMPQAGLLGFKSGRGFYEYRKGRPSRVSRELAPLLSATYRGPAGGVRHPAGDVADRLVDAMVNEAAHLIEEGAVDRPDVIDLAMIFGAGFPPFRGGLLRHADATGAGTIAGRLQARGETPARLLLENHRFHP